VAVAQEHVGHGDRVIVQQHVHVAQPLEHDHVVTVSRRAALANSIRAGRRAPMQAPPNDQRRAERHQAEQRDRHPRRIVE